MTDENADKQGKLLCTRCNTEIVDSDDYIISRCNEKECGLQDIHCHSEYVQLPSFMHHVLAVDMFDILLPFTSQLQALSVPTGV